MEAASRRQASNTHFGSCERLKSGSKLIILSRRYSVRKPINSTCLLFGTVVLFLLALPTIARSQGTSNTVSYPFAPSGTHLLSTNNGISTFVGQIPTFNASLGALQSVTISCSTPPTGLLTFQVWDYLLYSEVGGGYSAFNWSVAAGPLSINAGWQGGLHSTTLTPPAPGIPPMLEWTDTAPALSATGSLSGPGTVYFSRGPVNVFLVANATPIPYGYGVTAQPWQRPRTQ